VRRETSFFLRGDAVGGRPLTNQLAIIGVVDQFALLDGGRPAGQGADQLGSAAVENHLLDGLRRGLIRVLGVVFGVLGGAVVTHVPAGARDLDGAIGESFFELRLGFGIRQPGAQFLGLQAQLGAVELDAAAIETNIVIFAVEDAPALVQRMAQTFQRTDGDIASVLAMMFRSPEFNAAPKSKYKDPMQFVLSAVRLAYDDKVILNPGPILGWLGRLAQGLYNHETPDGYPMTAAPWSGPGQMAVRFEIARQIGSNSAGLFKPPGPDAVDHPAFPQIQNALYFISLQQTLSAPTRAALDQAVSPQDWNTLFLSSPEFMR